MHAVPAIIDETSFRAARATAGIGRGRTHHFQHLRDGNQGHGEDPFALRETHVIIHDIARTEHHRHAQGAGARQRLIDPGDDGIHPHGGGFAPVVVPDIHGNDAHMAGIHALRCGRNLTAHGIAGLEGQFDLRGREPAGDEQQEGEAEGGRPTAPALVNWQHGSSLRDPVANGKRANANLPRPGRRYAESP